MTTAFSLAAKLFFFLLRFSFGFFFFFLVFYKSSLNLKREMKGSDLNVLMTQPQNVSPPYNLAMPELKLNK